jgi:nitrate/TMAO reductase-like tetraheme cytochrome c subunit
VTESLPSERRTNVVPSRRAEYAASKTFRVCHSRQRSQTFQTFQTSQTPSKNQKNFFKNNACIEKSHVISYELQGILGLR